MSFIISICRSIGGNPFRCDCSLKAFIEFLRNLTHESSIYKKSKCATPTHLIDTELTNVMFEDMDCKDSCTYVTMLIMSSIGILMFLYFNLLKNMYFYFMLLILLSMSRQISRVSHYETVVTGLII